jgi:uncharacterized lipoprotein YddW (UPF0748 family)
MRNSLSKAVSFLLISGVLVACNNTSSCGCDSNCIEPQLYCIELPDGAVVCHSGADALASSPESPDISPRTSETLIPAYEIRTDSADTHNVADSLPPDSGGELTTPFVSWDGTGEVRGVWITRWDFASAEAIESIMDKVADAGFNSVFFQVRGIADAYYQSDFEPWAKGLSGTLGQNPGWDPLGTAVSAAHSRNLKIHAWVNTLVAWSGSTPPPASEPPHILAAHPEWRMAGPDGTPMAWNNSYTFVSPGIPEVREHLISVVVDIVEKYEVDGLHFDYIRYAGPDYSHDSSSVAGYAAARDSEPGLSWEDYQRQILSGFVGDAYSALLAADSEIQVTAAVWGIYKDEFDWGGTSQGYYDYYQDSHGWLESGIIDAICPMIYWPMTDPKGGWTDYATLAEHHVAAASGRHVYAGLLADYDDFGEIADEISFLRSIPSAGYVVFSYATMLEHAYGSQMALEINPQPAKLPAMPWKATSR